MSATITMVAVHKPAPTQMVHFSAAVTLGLDWIVTEELATASVYCVTVLSFSTYIGMSYLHVEDGVV